MIADHRITDPLLQLLVERAAEEGAKKALASIGLHDEDAANDVRELRSLLEVFRDTKKTVIQTVWKSVTAGVLALLIAGTGIKMFFRE